MREGKEGRISHIKAGRGLTRRLIEMGFVEGALVRILRADFRGPVMVIINGSKYALGRGMAMKIMIDDC
ncbi:MAG: FeoA family protein [Thermoplasmata archaeon]|nr:FeoA family protein [Thermoplasmata archaeon]